MEDPKRLSGPALRLARGELIGLRVRVARATDAALVGVSGLVEDETLGMFVVRRDDGRSIRLAKASCVFAFETADGPVELDGTRLRFRPEDRTKRIR